MFLKRFHFNILCRTGKMLVCLFLLIGGGQPALALSFLTFSTSNMSVNFADADINNIIESRVCRLYQGNCDRYANKIRIEVRYDSGKTRVYEGSLPTGTSVTFEYACDLPGCPYLRRNAMSVIGYKNLSLTSSSTSVNGSVTGVYATLGFERRGKLGKLRGYAELTWYWSRAQIDIPVTSCAFNIGEANFGILNVPSSYGRQVKVSINGLCTQSTFVIANIGNPIISGEGAIFRVKTVSGSNIGGIQCYASSFCAINFDVVFESYRGTGGIVKLSAPIILNYD